MSLTTGSRLGPYEIVALLGAGGMGEVYRARDTRLQRIVAIKVLPLRLASDPQFRQRFDREAHAAAALNHPHICTLYDVGEQDGVAFLVMEYVEGETLADRLQRGPLPIEQALQYAIDIADALDKAHHAGIVHRDLKPANIMLTTAGLKVLDFGLAKLEQSDVSPVDLSQSPTALVHHTRVGFLLGTAAYMSPEQARGSKVDARTDIWAFGCVLYEMLTAQTAFARETIPETLARVIDHEPPWEALPPSTPAGLKRLLHRCLEKHPSRRMHCAADVRIAIEDAIVASDTSAIGTERPSRTAAVVPWLVSAAAILLAATVVWSTARRRDPDLPMLRLNVETMPTPDPTSFALSPDGHRVVFAATDHHTTRLWIQELDQAEPQRLGDTEDASYPFWAPNSRSVGFFASGLLKRLDLGGGRPQVLAQARNPMGGCWSRGDVILYVPSAASPVMRVPARGGTPTAITQFASGELSHRFPSFLPDGRHFLILVTTNAPETAGVYLASTEASDARHRILSIDSNAEYAPPGYLIAVRDGVLIAMRFDLQRESVSGDPVALSGHVALRQGRGALSVSSSGLLAYRIGTRTSETPELRLIRRDGSTITTFPAQGYIALTRDGRRIAISQGTPSGTLSNTDIWLMDMTRRVPQRFTFDPAFEISPVWSPDGSRVAFASNRDGPFDLFVKPANFASDERILLQTPTNKFPADWSPDGRVLLFVNEDARTGDDLWTTAVAEPHNPVPFVAGPYAESQGQFSPDGRWVAYRSNESGQWEVYVRPYPGPGTQQLVSRGGGIQPRWRGDGRELFYFAPDSHVMSVSIGLTAQGDTLEIGAPMPLFTARLWGLPNQQFGYAVDPTGQRFLTNIGSDETSTTPITVVQNWQEELKQRVPTR